jgi:hypothetical protein
MTFTTWAVPIATGVIGAGIGSWARTVRARWQLGVEATRSGRDRRENQLHRQRFAEVYHLWHDEPDEAERVKLSRWYTEWTGAAPPRQGGIFAGPQAPGFGCADESEAYERYLATLEARHNPGRLGRRRWHLRIIGRRQQRAGEPGT